MRLAKIFISTASTASNNSNMMSPVPHHKRDDVCEFRFAGGDTHLGGEDFDSSVQDWVISEFKKKNAKQLAAMSSGVCVCVCACVCVCVCVCVCQAALLRCCQV